MTQLSGSGQEIAAINFPSILPLRATAASRASASSKLSAYKSKAQVLPLYLYLPRNNGVLSGEFVMKFEMYKDDAGEWRLRLRADNRKDVIADSGEGYVNKSDCEKGINLVMSTTSETPIIFLS